MAMNLRLSPTAEERLDQLSHDTGMTKTAVIEDALVSYDERTAHRARIREIFDRIEARDAELLERLAG